MNVGHLKRVVKNKIGNVLKNINCYDLILWSVNVPTEGEDLETKIYAENIKEQYQVIDAINIALKNATINIYTLMPDDQMPFMERDTNQAITRIIRNIENHLKGSKSKADFDILVSGGAPGIGKTRFGQELFKHMENNQNDWVPSEWTDIQLKDLYLDFGNNCRLDSYDDELTPTVIIGLRIAYVFFIESKYNMKFETFRDQVWKHRDIFKISNVFNCIYDHLSQPNQQLFMFLHIDEFQLIDRWERDAVNERKMPVKQLFKEMINNLASFMLGPSSNIYVQAFLSGTAPQVVISAKESSRVSFGFVNCPQLSFKALLNIANHYAQKYDAEKFSCGTYKWMLCRPFLQLLEDTGGLPRALQYIFDVCFEIEVDRKKFFDDIYQQHFNTIFYNVKQHLQERYNIYEAIDKNEKLALELLFHSIYAIPVYRKTCLDLSDQDCTIENLERDTHIILNPCNDNSSEFTINMPFFFICLYNDKLKIIDFNLEETLRVQNSMHWELFVAYYDAFRTNLLVKRGKHTVRLGELYSGAYGTELAKNFEVRLKKVSVRRAQEQFPCLKLTEKDSAKPIPWEEGEDVIVNGGSAKWGDSFRVLESVQGDLFLSIHQAKYDYNSATYTLKDLFNEHIKNCESSAFNTTKQLFNQLADYRHLTIVFTTQPIYEIVPYDDCFIISRNNFEQYFGPVFSSRATFAFTKNINPNFSELQRMMECQPGVGDVTAENIIINRPYKSEDDFFKKHNRAKRGKEKHEHENPEKKLKLDFYPFNL
ncbi:3876_t:CDS:2 [Acaulospora morrowiae]|uniref:3876_t:CDS:1 n=1 Tax=Acaulospora morrowiae TaxID=94023 RepID=A0A9N9BP40_9GLOM|nr:3876_t:CDS:2 [Acaulospora morrowiae]